MRMLQGFAGLHENGNDPFYRDMLIGFDNFGETLPFKKVHDQIGLTAGDKTIVIDSDYIGMLEV